MLNEVNYLIRFLRARKLDVNNTFTMFTDYLEWRKKENIDQYLKVIKF